MRINQKIWGPVGVITHLVVQYQKHQKTIEKTPLSKSPTSSVSSATIPPINPNTLPVTKVEKR
jgi:hypothetical protein